MCIRDRSLVATDISLGADSETEKQVMAARTMDTEPGQIHKNANVKPQIAMASTKARGPGETSSDSESEIHEDEKENVGAGLSQDNASGNPSIFFHETQHDFGTVYRGEDINYAYRVENRGDSMSQIKNIRGSCDCTSVMPDHLELEPGQSGEIEVRFSTYGYEGRVFERIYFECDDTCGQNSWLILKGVVKNAIEISPSYLYFDKVQPYLSTCKTIKVTSGQKVDFEMTRIVTSDPWIRASQARAMPEGGYEMDITVLSESAPALSLIHISEPTRPY